MDVCCFVLVLWENGQAPPRQRGIDTDTNVGEVGLNFFQLPNKYLPQLNHSPPKICLANRKGSFSNHQFCRGKLLHFEDVNEFYVSWHFHVSFFCEGLVQSFCEKIPSGGCIFSRYELEKVGPDSCFFWCNRFVFFDICPPLLFLLFSSHAFTGKGSLVSQQETGITPVWYLFESISEF